MDGQFDALMRDVMAGSEAAAQQLFKDYEPLLLHAIRRRLNKHIRSKFDSLDIAQDVWASFFAEIPEKRQFESPEHLMAFLTTLAKNKVVDTTRHTLMTQKRNPNREQSLDDSQRFDKANLAGPQATPSQIVMSQEEWSAFLRRQPLVYRRVFILMVEGKTATEIADELHIDAKTVRRIMARAAALAPEGGQ